MQNLKFTAIAAGILLFILACNGTMQETHDMVLSENNHSIAGLINDNEDHKKVKEQFQPEPPVTKQQLHQKESTLIQSTYEKKIVKKANLDISIKDFIFYSSYLKNTVKNSGGYIAHEEQVETDYFIQNTLTIKVPVTEFDKLVTQLLEHADKTFQKNINAEDVTTQVVDTRARLDAKKAVRLRYIELLKQAKNLEEILQVQNEINDIQETIEATSSKLEHLQSTSAFSTINITFKQISNEDFLNAENTFSNRLGESFRNGWQWIKEFVLGLVMIWPLIIIGFLTWAIMKKIMKQKIPQPKL
jgi:hypothetical protein